MKKVFLAAPRVGFEPTTNRLTVDRSTAELPRNIHDQESRKPVFGTEKIIS
jgi:hypothetical protein